MIRIARWGIGQEKRLFLDYLDILFLMRMRQLKKFIPKIKNFSKLKKNYWFFIKWPIQKKDLIKTIIKNESNIKKILEIIHPEVRKELRKFLRKNIKKKAVVLDIPLFLENKLYLKKDIIIFIQASNKEVLKKLKKRKNFNKLILQKLKKLQFPLYTKKKKSHYVINNNFKEDLARKNVRDILNKILIWKKWFSIQKQQVYQLKMAIG